MAEERAPGDTDDASVLERGEGPCGAAGDSADVRLNGVSDRC